MEVVNIMSHLSNIVRILLLKLIKLYQILPIPHSCRFIPSCSEYTAQAIEKYGGLKGISLGIRRLLHCHPYSPGGDNPLN